MDTHSSVAIIGAGVSGLAVATRLVERGQPITVIDSGSRAGGAIQTTLKDGYLAEHGPNSLLVRDQRLLNLMETIGAHSVLACDEAKKRYIVQNGKPHAMPSSPLGMLTTPLFSMRGKLRFCIEPLIGRYGGNGEECFADFVTRRLGKEMLESAAGPFVSGIYAGDPAKLAVRHAFPRLWNLEKNHRSFILGALALQFSGNKDPNRLSPARMVSFEKGMGELPQAMANHLPSGALQLNSQVSAITSTNGRWDVSWTDENGKSETKSFGKLVLAVPHHKLLELPLPDAIRDKLTVVSKIDSPAVTSLVLGFKRKQVAHPLDGFGMLIKAAEKSPLLGVLFSSSMFNGRAPEDRVTLTCMMGGVAHPEFAKNSDEIVLAELRKLLGVSGEPTFSHRTSWQKAIPQYGLDYQQVINAINATEKEHKGLHLAGNYRGGISVSDCLLNGLNLGEQLAK
ncbi:MAG: protoporphyrinogen oxidase [Akkermansiaceae bacterium]